MHACTIKLSEDPSLIDDEDEKHFVFNTLYLVSFKLWSDAIRETFWISENYGELLNVF